MVYLHLPVPNLNPLCSAALFELQVIQWVTKLPKGTCVCSAITPEAQISIRFGVRQAVFELQAILIQEPRMTPQTTLNTTRLEVPHIMFPNLKFHSISVNNCHFQDICNFSFFPLSTMFNFYHWC